MRYPTAIGFIAMLTGCAITPAPSESKYARCGIDSGQWSVMPAPGDAEKLVAIARQHQGEPEGKDREIYWFASNLIENAVAVFVRRLMSEVIFHLIAFPTGGRLSMPIALGRLPKTKATTW